MRKLGKQLLFKIYLRPVGHNRSGVPYSLGRLTFAGVSVCLSLWRWTGACGLDPLFVPGQLNSCSKNNVKWLLFMMLKVQRLFGIEIRQKIPPNSRENRSHRIQFQDTVHTRAHETWWGLEYAQWSSACLLTQVLNKLRNKRRNGAKIRHSN